MIRFDDVSFAYGQDADSRRALDGVSFTCARGEWIAILGSNGSGKSTTVRLVNGLLLPSKGRVTVSGYSTADASRARELRESVGVVFQNPDDQIVATSVEDDVAFGPENMGVPREEIRRRVDAALEAVGLRGFERREPHLLSGGQKQRLAIAGAVAMQPDYIVLDEPTSMLDPRGRDEVLAVVESLRARSHGVMMVTHDLAEAARADRVLVLDAGRIAFEGTPGELISNAELVETLGLELPGIAVLTSELRRMGVSLPLNASTPASVVDAL